MERGSMEYSSRQRYWVFEIKLASCTDLKAFNFFQKLSVYAIVSLKVISDDAEKKVKEAEEQMNEEVVEEQIKKTPTDGEGDGNPEWNHEMRFEFDHNGHHRQLKDGRLLIHFDLRHRGLGILGIGDRSIGEVRVPLNDLMISYIPPSPANNFGLGLGGVQQQARHVNYQVRTSDEKPNGILTFSYKLNLLIKGAGTDDQPRIQYPTITLKEDDDDDIMHKFNDTSTQVDDNNSNIASYGSHQQQQQQQQEEYYYRPNISSAAPAHNNHYSQSQSQLQADHQQICSSCLPQYHHPYDPPVEVAVAVAAHRTYYPPPPPPPLPPPMADHGASYPYHPPPPGHGMVHPPWPPHPYHDYGPWSPPAGIGRPHGHGHGHQHGIF